VGVASILNSVDYSNTTFVMPLIEMPATEAEEIPAPVQGLIESCKLHDAQSYESQHEHEYDHMTPSAKAAFKVFRDMGPDRTLPAAAELLGRKSASGLQGWSSKYEWVRLCAEYDHIHVHMSPKVAMAYKVYRDMGPSRTLKEAARLLDKSESLLRGYSSQHDWTRLVTEHDHRCLLIGD
jgi:hypothetical protein